ncbi:MAG TPA: hypothetical protein VFC67_05935 [Prolixibacteraceae bacterium]|nr:hypothetical protein [Prolixibacteraceae bacterium]
MKSFIWIFAILITAAAGYYQRVTGPTKPLKTEVSNGIQRFPVVFQRTHGGTTDCPVELQISDITVKGFLLYRKYPSKDEMTKIELKREGDKLTAFLPNQPPAGKLEYKVALEKDGNPIILDNGASVIIRFKGEVPHVVLIIHIILMFLGMLFSNVTGIYALFRIRSYKFMTVLTFAILAVGGLVLGPIVQKYAFNEWWAGVPFGWDLTDNKTLIAILVWLMALEMLRNKNSAFWVVLASLVTIVIFAIPHSLFGSQLDQETGKIIQGAILPFLQLF